MAEWKKIITSGSTAEVAGLSSSLALVPTTDAGADLGSTGLEWNNLFIDGTANIDSLVADTADINGGTIDGITSLTAGGNLDIGAHDLRAATLTADGLTSGRVVIAGTDGVLSDDGDLTFSGDTLTATKIGAFEAAGAIDFSDEAMTNVNIDSGDIAGTNITVGSSKTLDVSAGTLTLANDQISGDKIDGGTIGSTTITTLTGTTITGTTIKNFATISSSEAGTGSFGRVEVDTTGSFGHIITPGGTISGSFQGDGSNLTGVGFQIDELSNTLTAVAQADLLVVADADGSNEEKKITFSNFEDQIFSNINAASSDISIAAGGAITLANNSVGNDEMADDAVGTDEIADDAVTYAKIQNVSATDRILGRDSSGAGVIEEITPANLRTMINVEDGATADQTGAEIATALNSDLGGNFTIGNQSDDTATFSGPVIVTGDLTVNGTTTTISSSNTEIRDQFLFLNSGSNSGDGGIIVQNGAHNTGSMFAFDDSADRWAFNSGSGKTDTLVVPHAHAAEVVTNDNLAYKRKNGNIRVQGGEIYIYVE